MYNIFCLFFLVHVSRTHGMFIVLQLCPLVQVLSKTHSMFESLPAVESFRFAFSPQSECFKVYRDRNILIHTRACLLCSPAQTANTPGFDANSLNPA